MKKQLYLLFAALFCCIQFSKAQPAFFNPINVTEPHNMAQTNFPVLITVNTQALITAGQMLATGADIRFATDNNCPTLATFLDYYIESGINTPNTRIWVRLPSLAAGATDEIYMFYGNPSATPMSSFAATFPNAVTVTSGNNVTLTGTQNIGWLQVDAGGTLSVQAGSTLTINAERVIINGTVDGLGRGHVGGAISTTGTGPGAGTAASPAAAGAGGGSYGGQGGLGGLDAGDNPGNGGPVYGTPTGADIAMGSGGGGATVAGGAGGGCITFNSNEMTLAGSINMTGVTPPTNASSGGGGGAGGGVLIRARALNGTGTINANGGGGSNGTSTANDGGGGGGGGRIKLFVNNTPTVVTNVTGGAGGAFGTQAPGQPGAAGTANTIPTTFPTLTLGTQAPAFVTPTVSIAANPGTTVCPGGSVTFTATPTNGGTPTYQWYRNGVLQPGNTNTYTGSGFTTGNTIIAIMSSTASCVSSPTATSNTLTMTALPTVTPDVTITANPGTTICPAQSVTFTATPVNGGTPTYQWFKNNVLQASTSNTFTDNTITNGAAIKVVMTPVGVCPSTPTDTSNIITMTVNPNVTPAVSIASNQGTSVCDGASITFTATPTNGGTPTYQWYKDNVLQAGTGNTFTDNTLTNGNVITAVMSAVGVCTTTPTANSNAITMTVIPNVTPDVTIAVSPSTDICSGATATFTATPINGGITPTYEWFRNNILQAGTGPTYTDNNIGNGDIIKSVLTSSEACVTAQTDTSNNVIMTVTPATGTLAGAAGTTEADNEDITGATQVHYTDCDLIATITPSGVSPVSGTVNVSVTIDNAVSTYNTVPYVQRHFDIVPATNPSTSTATITLYALQSEFDAYNAAAYGYPMLPTGGVDNGMVKITQFHGTGTAPGNYTDTAEVIIPTVSWDANNNWWVMTFPVTGFSGFYIHTAWTNDPLVITLANIKATNVGPVNRINWETASEDAGDAFTLERSLDGKVFSSLTNIPANGVASKYVYNDDRAATGINYYRIKLTDKAGSIKYSNVVTARVNSDDIFSVNAYPNPAKDKLTITTAGTRAEHGNIMITDIMGRVMTSVPFTGEHMQLDISNLAVGNYIIKYTDDVHTSTIKLTKQ